MVRPSNNNGSVESINSRRSQLLLLLAEGKTLSQCSQILKAPISTINEDNKYIKSQGLKFLGNISKQELSYNFYVSMATILTVSRDCINIAKDKDNVSLKDRLRAYQIVLQSTNQKDNLLLIASKSFAWEELNDKVKNLNSMIDIDNNLNSNENKISDILNQDMLIDKTIKIKSKDIKTNNQLQDKTKDNKNKTRINTKTYTNYVKVDHKDLEYRNIKSKENKIK